MTSDSEFSDDDDSEFSDDDAESVASNGDEGPYCSPCRVDPVISFASGQTTRGGVVSNGAALVAPDEPPTPVAPTVPLPTSVAGLVGAFANMSVVDQENAFAFLDAIHGVRRSGPPLT